MLSLKHWETYHRSGALATCPTGPDGTYDQEMRDVWTRFLSVWPDQARILDVGTGNGAVALIALETATALGRTWEIHGTDMAQIDPLRHVTDGVRRLAGIRFHAGVATEHLPFDAGSFDVVTGQYALEYADVPAALGEIRRVLKPGGRAQFIVHHADSVLFSNALQSLREAEFVLNDIKIYRRLRRIVTVDHLSPYATRRATKDLRLAIQALKRELVLARAAGVGHILGVTLDAVQQLLIARTQMKPTAADLEIGRVEGELRAAVHRLKDLTRTAQTNEGIAEIERLAGDAGFGIEERAPQYHATKNLVGWRLVLVTESKAGSVRNSVCEPVGVINRSA